MPVNDQKTQVSPLWIKIDGRELGPEELGQVLDLTVEQDLVLPDAFAIRLHDIHDRPGQGKQVHGQLLDDDRFQVGAGIEIGLGREDRPRCALKGQITGIELDARGDAPALVVVRGYDGAHRLHNQRKTRTFRNMSDSDIVSQVARDHGLTPRCDSTPEVTEHVFQDNQTDWEFLRGRAERVGFELLVQDRELVFRRPAASQTALEEELGTTLHRLRLRLSAPHQVEEVTVKGWDPATKREITGRATRPTQRPSIGESRTGADLGQKAASGQPGKFVLAEQPVRTDGEANALAQSVLDTLAGEFIQLEGTCLGNADLRPGKPIKLKNLGHRFDGEYYLSAVSHKVTPTEGYLSHFTVSGRKPVTLTSLLTGNGSKPVGNGGAGRHSGVVVGLVTNNKDPDQGGRVRVRFPWLGEDESHWARLASPMAGDGRGWYFLPEVGDEVLVAFEHGDINHPYVIGALWNGREKPPKPAGEVVGATGRVNQRILKSRLGHTITLDDSDEQPSISIVDKTGKNSIKFDSITNKLTVSVQGDMALEAQTKVSVKGATVEIEASGPLTIKGAVVNIN